MKSRLFAPVLPPCFFVLFFLIPSARSQEASPFDDITRAATDERVKQLHIQVEWIELDAASATKLLLPEDPANPAAETPSNAGPLRSLLQRMIDDDEATLLDSTMVAARSGQRAKVESIHEFTYPVEFTPGEILNPSDADPVQVPPQAAAFETRNVGTTLEVDPVLAPDQRLVDLNLAPELVYLVGKQNWGSHRSGGGKVEIETPTFYTVKVTTQLATIAGQYGLMAMQTPRDAKTGMPDPMRRVLVFVKADLVVVDIPVEEPERKENKRD